PPCRAFARQVGWHTQGERPRISGRPGRIGKEHGEAGHSARAWALLAQVLAVPLGSRKHHRFAIAIRSKPPRMAQTTFDQTADVSLSTGSATGFWALDLTDYQNSAGAMTLKLSAIRASDGAAKHWLYHVAFKRPGSGNTVATPVLLSTQGTAGDLIALVAVGISFRIQDN